MQTRRAPPYTSGIYPAHAWDFDALAGAGALRSTVNDMLRFIAALLADEDDCLPALRFCLEPLAFEAGRAGDQGPLGWITTKTSTHSYEMLWHNGGTGGYHAFLGFDREQQIGLVALSNSDDFLLDHACFDAMNSLHGYETTPPVYAMPPEALQGFAGAYRLAGDRGRVVLEYKDGMLISTDDQNHNRLLVPLAPQRFHLVGLPEGYGVEFQQAEGRIQSATLSLGKETIPLVPETKNF